MKRVLYLLSGVVLLYLFLAGILLVSSCSSDSDGGYDSEKTENPKNVTLELSRNDLVFEAAGGEKTFTVSCNGNWSIENGSGWCKTDFGSGTGNLTVTVTVDEYSGMEDRNTNLTVKAGVKTAVLSVTQKYKDAIILSKNKFEVEPKGDTISVEVKSNVTNTVTIPDSYRSWIQQVPALRAVTDTTYRFVIAGNMGKNFRAGYILFSAGSLRDTVFISQNFFTLAFDPAFASLLQRKGYIPDSTHILLENVQNIDFLNVGGTYNDYYVRKKGLTSLKGIEYFESLTSLVCDYNQLTSLDVSKNTKLTYLKCCDNKLTSLDVSKNIKLEHLDCNYNNLTSLDISKNTKLTFLNCSDNKLTSLDVSKNIKLEGLYCYYNNLRSLDVSKNIKLRGLGVYSLTSLDLSKNTKLTFLSCSNNKFTSLDVSKNTKLTYLKCCDNKLTSLDVSKNIKLEELYCYGNPGDGESLFPVTAWFDNNNIPGNMKFNYSYDDSDGKTWDYDGKTISIDFRKAE